MRKPKTLEEINASLRGQAMPVESVGVSRVAAPLSSAQQYFLRTHKAADVVPPPPPPSQKGLSLEQEIVLSLGTGLVMHGIKVGVEQVGKILKGAPAEEPRAVSAAAKSTPQKKPSVAPEPVKTCTARPEKNSTAKAASASKPSAPSKTPAVRAVAVETASGAEMSVDEVDTGAASQFKPVPKGRASELRSAPKPATAPASSDKVASGFSPDLKKMQLSQKPGSDGDSRLFTRKDGRYTTLSKEAAASVEQNQTRSSASVKTDFAVLGAKGTAKYDLEKGTFAAKLKVGGDCRHTVFQSRDEVGVGSMSSAVDLGTAEASFTAETKYGQGKFSADANATVGATLLSVTREVETREAHLFGLSGSLKGSVSEGVGVKGTVGIGLAADVSKLSVKGHMNFGLFKGLGTSRSVDVEVGIDPKFGEYTSESWQRTVENEPVLRGIIEHAKTHGHLQPWQQEYLDDAVTRSNADATMRRNKR